MTPIPDVYDYIALGLMAPEPDTEPLWDESDEPDGPQGREYRDEETR